MQNEPKILFPLRYASYPEDSDEYKLYLKIKEMSEDMGLEIVDKTDDWVIHIYDR